MKKEVAKKWVKALRSGKYKQGYGYLKQLNSKNQPRHCCLGVLCELYNDTMKKNHKKTLKVVQGIDITTFNNKSDILPTVVAKWAGIKNNSGTFSYEAEDKYGKIKLAECLAQLNDVGTKFSTIADIIEKNVENL